MSMGTMATLPLYHIINKQPSSPQNIELESARNLKAAYPPKIK